jgi:hypothetical protein
MNIDLDKWESYPKLRNSLIGYVCLIFDIF